MGIQRHLVGLGVGLLLGLGPVLVVLIVASGLGRDGGGVGTGGGLDRLPDSLAREYMYHTSSMVDPDLSRPPQPIPE